MRNFSATGRGSEVRLSRVAVRVLVRPAFYHDTVTSSAFAGLSDADRYVLGRLAAREHVPVEELAELPQDEIDQHIPGARVVYERREQIAAELLRRRGIDPMSAEYRAAAIHARNVLDQIDELGSGHTA